MRLLTKNEEDKLKALTKNTVSLTLIEITATGLRKSIMDATGPVRNYLKINNIHDYYLQSQGPENKEQINSLIYGDFSVYDSKASFYRPKTKKGDPRIWFKGLSNFTNPNDILALTWYDNIIHVINLTRLDVIFLIETTLSNPLKELINSIKGFENEIANELLGLLKKIAQNGPIPSVVNADTSVGRTLEAALGIDINSSKKPDYKGIELKSFRHKKGNRKNLFAQVPNWNLSKFKSSSEILCNFGYWRKNEFKLYCTISSITINSQGLSLRLDTNINYLFENSDRSEIGDFVLWTLDKLHERLLEKHRETFWVAANTININETEHFHYTEVEHTRKPIISQFDLLIEQGIITLDHLIKRNNKGQVIEKGPLFKIKPNSLDLLFPPSVTYNLLQ